MKMFTSDQSLQLLEQLVDLTERRRLKWDDFPTRLNGLTASLPRFRLVLDSVDDDGVQPFRLTVYRIADGNEESEFDEIVAEANPDDREQWRINEWLESLWTVAQRQVTGADAVIDDLFTDLRRTFEPPAYDDAEEPF